MSEIRVSADSKNMNDQHSKESSVRGCTLIRGASEFLTGLAEIPKTYLGFRKADALAVSLPDVIEVVARYSKPVAVGGFNSFCALWNLDVVSGPLAGRSLTLSYRDDLEGESYAFITDDGALHANPHILVKRDSKDLKRFKYAAIAAGEGTTLEVKLTLKKPNHSAGVMPYTVTDFTYSVRTVRKVPKGELLN